MQQHEQGALIVGMTLKKYIRVCRYCKWTVHADRTYCLEMAQRCDSTKYTAEQAPEILQNIASDESGVDYSDEEEQNEIFQLLQNVTRDEDENTESSSNDCDDIPSLKIRLKSSTGCASILTAVCGRESARNRGTREFNDFTSNDDALFGKDGSVWKPIPPKLGSIGHFCSQNILHRRPGPTTFAATRVQQDNEASAFCLFFDELMVRHICKCTTEEGVA